METRRIMLGIM